MKINRWGFDVELLYLAKKNGFKIKEIPVLWDEKGGSKLKLKDIYSIFLDLVKIRLRYITRKSSRI